MDASAWTRIKRGKALSSGVGLIQPNTSGDVLMERQFVNGPILFNGKVVSECCVPAPTSAEAGTIVLQFSPFVAFDGMGNTLAFLALDGTGTVDFGNGFILPISGVVAGQIYPVGSTVTIRSSDITVINIWGINSQGLTSIVCNQTLPMLTTVGVGGSNTLSTLDISAVGSSLVYLDCAGCPGITAITGLGACTRLQVLSIPNCSLSGQLDITGSVATLTTLKCNSNTGITAITGLSNCTQLTTLYVDGCSLSGPLDITGSVATLTILNCNSNAGITKITGLSNCSKLTNLICYGCGIIGRINITKSSAVLQYLLCYNNHGITEISGLLFCTQLIILNCDGCNLSDPLFILGSAATISTLRCNGNAGIANLDVTNCSILNNLVCDGCNITQIAANTIVSALVTNGVSNGSLAILTQQYGNLTPDSGWAALGNATGSSGLGWTIT